MMIKKIKKRYRQWRYFRSMNRGLFFLSRLDIVTKDMTRTKQKQFWGELRSPISRVRVLRELFEIMNK